MIIWMLLDHANDDEKIVLETELILRLDWHLGRLQ